MKDPPPLPLPPTAIIVNGKRYEVRGQRVKTWHETGLEFRAGDGFNRARAEPVTRLVLHWTGSENSVPTMFRVLKQRKLGVQFAIERDGTIYQFCDPARVACAHAGGYNGASVGVEIVNYGIRRFGPRPDGSRLPSLWRVPKLGRDRPTHVETLHGRKVTVAGFYAAQMGAAVWLGQALHVALGIDLTSFPRDGNGEIFTRAMSLPERATFKGVCGHFELTPDKFDPGLDLLRHCDREWNA
jgi:hypothetical protein